MKKRLKVLHLCHGLYGDNNGVDRYIKTYTEIMDHDNFIVVPLGINKNNLPNTIEMESLEQLPEIMDTLRVNLLIIHWTGAEAWSLEDREDIFKYKGRLISMSGKEKKLDNSENSLVDCVQLFHPWERNFKIAVITHTTYPLPCYLSKVCVDAIIHVSQAAYQVNENLENNHQVIYPPLAERFLPEPKINPSSKIRIGWLGRLNKYDRVVYTHLKEKYGNRQYLDFIFAGEGKLDDEPPENFLFPGNMDPVSFFENIDVFLYPTIIDSFSLAFLEAMSQGKPCLVSPVVKELAEIGLALVYNNIEEFQLYLRFMLFGNYRHLAGELHREKVLDLFHPDIYKNKMNQIINNLVHGVKV